jgi:hypothetical protein
MSLYNASPHADFPRSNLKELLTKRKPAFLKYRHNGALHKHTKNFKPNVQLPSSDTQTVTSAIPLTVHFTTSPARIILEHQEQ